MFSVTRCPCIGVPGAVCRTVRADGTAAAPISALPVFVPHSGQNRALSSICIPQFGQNRSFPPCFVFQLYRIQFTGTPRMSETTIGELLLLMFLIVFFNYDLYFDRGISAFHSNNCFPDGNSFYFAFSGNLCYIAV